jgi:hypothetical protein
MKIPLPDPYASSAKLKDIEIFVSSMLRWLKLNFMLRTASQDWQLAVLGTHLTSEAQEWYMHNVEFSTQTIQTWDLETMILGLQHRFLPMLTHRHAVTDFDTVHQSNGIVQELYNLMIKLAEQMVHPPNEYTFQQRFIEALQPSISTKVLELSYNAERHNLQQLYITEKQLDEVKLYTSIYNKAAMQGDQQHVVQAIWPTMVPARASIQVSRPPANKSLPVYRPAILIVVNKPLPWLLYLTIAKPAVGMQPGPPPTSTGNSATCHNWVTMPL